jgi:hypothetical protein
LHSMSSPPVVGSLCSSIFSFLCRALWIIVCTFILFHLVIVVSVLPRFTFLITPFVSSNFSSRSVSCALH